MKWGIVLDWLNVKGPDELRQLGTFNEVRKQIKNDGGKHIHITGRSWEGLWDSINEFKQKLKILKIAGYHPVEVNVVKEKTSEKNSSASKYFTSLANEYIFYLTELDGELRMNKLGIKGTHFSNKRKAKLWRDKISKIIHPDVCNHENASEAMAQLNDLYSQMVGRD